MQPNHDPSDWQQPSPQPSQAPYVPVPADEPQKAAPVVTLSPEAAGMPVAAQDVSPEEVSTPTSAEPVRWQATEYIHHDKSALWFVIFGIIVVVIMAIAIIFIRSITFDILVPVMAASLLVYAYRPPRLIDYTLSRQGLHVNDRLYPFSEFKGFGVVRDGGEYSVMLLPVKRFKPGVSVYFPEEAGEAIVDMLGVRLPMQELHLDIVDQIIRKLRL
jgi:hypothetical protein